jgi:hypothetical protein
MAIGRKFCTYFVAPTAGSARGFVNQGCRVPDKHGEVRVYPPIGRWLNSPFPIPVVYRADGAKPVVSSHRVRMVRVLPATEQWSESSDWEC